MFGNKSRKNKKDATKSTKSKIRRGVDATTYIPRKLASGAMKPLEMVGRPINKAVANTVMNSADKQAKRLEKGKKSAKKALRVGELVGLEEYKRELETNKLLSTSNNNQNNKYIRNTETKKRNKSIGSNMINRGNEGHLFSLDDFLGRRKEQKNREFKKLQQERGFYFSPTLDEQLRREEQENEGMFLLGVNLFALIDLIKNPPEKLTNKDMSDASISLVGEYVDQPAVPTRLDDMFIDAPEYRISSKSSLSNIATSSRTRNMSELGKDISPYNMAKLVKYMQTTAVKPEHYRQTLIAASVIYEYLSLDNEDPILFFKSKNKIEGSTIKDLEEYYRSWDIFNASSDLRKIETAIEKIDIDDTQV